MKRGMSQLLSCAPKQAILSAFSTEYLYSSVLFHPKHEDLTQQILQPQKEVGNAADWGNDFHFRKIVLIKNEILSNKGAMTLQSQTNTRAEFII